MTHLDGFLITLLHLTVVLHLEPFCPSPLVQIQEHALLSLCLAVIDRQT
jgi:hypothetical protein